MITNDFSEQSLLGGTSKKFQIGTFVSVRNNMSIKETQDKNIPFTTEKTFFISEIGIVISGEKNTGNYATVAFVHPFVDAIDLLDHWLEEVCEKDVPEKLQTLLRLSMESHMRGLLTTVMSQDIQVSSLGCVGTFVRNLKSDDGTVGHTGPEIQKKNQSPLMYGIIVGAPAATPEKTFVVFTEPIYCVYTFDNNILQVADANKVFKKSYDSLDSISSLQSLVFQVCLQTQNIAQDKEMKALRSKIQAMEQGLEKIAADLKQSAVTKTHDTSEKFKITIEKTF